MNGYQFIIVMNDLMLNIELGMRMTNPNKGLSRLKGEYKQMLGLPRNTKNKDLFIALFEAVVSINRDKLNEDFVNHCEEFYTELMTEKLSK
jgi:hypothetical protein